MRRRHIKLLKATIPWHYWIDWAQKSRKNNLTYKRKKCCFTKTMHRTTSSWKRLSNWMNYASNCFLTHHILQIWPPAINIYSISFETTSRRLLSCINECENVNQCKEKTERSINVTSECECQKIRFYCGIQTRFTKVCRKSFLQNEFASDSSSV